MFFSIYSFSRKVGLSKFPEVNAILGLTLICIFLFAPLTARLFFTLNILNRPMLTIAGIITFLLVFRAFRNYFIKEDKWKTVVDGCKKANFKIRFIASIFTVLIVILVCSFAVSTQKSIFLKSTPIENQSHKTIQKFSIDSNEKPK